MVMATAALSSDSLFIGPRIGKLDADHSFCRARTFRGVAAGSATGRNIDNDSLCLRLLDRVFAVLGRTLVLWQSLLPTVDADFHHRSCRHFHCYRRILECPTCEDSGLRRNRDSYRLESRLHFSVGDHLVPARGPISWREMTHNQFTVVPVAIVDNVERYILHRHALMNDIEKSDVKQLERTGPRPN